MAQRIDFQFVKQEADFLAVLTHYGLEAHGSGVSRAIRCPFHPDTKPSLKVNLGRKGFHCFGCGAKGNVLEFVRRKKGLGENDLRGAARQLAAICGIPMRPSGAAPKAAAAPADAQNGPKTIKKGQSAPLSAAGEAPAARESDAEAPEENVPLDPAFIERFEGKLVREHPYLAERGLSPELVAHFALGFYPDEGKGMMRNRVVIPIHNDAGEMLAYAGRWVGPDEDLPEGKDKYQLPAGFHKLKALYNLHRVAGRKHLIVVEGFFSVFRLHQLGVPAVALMGRTLSHEQLALLEASGARCITVLLDGDESGRSAVRAMMALLARSPLRAKFAVLPDGSQPDTAPWPVVRELLGLS